MKASVSLVSLSCLFWLLSCQSSQRRLTASSSPVSPTVCPPPYSPDCDFKAWQLAFKKEYSSQEEVDFRFAIFCENCTFVKSNQAGTYSLKLTEFTASTQSELNSHFGLRNQNLSQNSDAVNQRVQTSMANIKVGVALPTTLDFRNYNGQNHVSPVQNQGTCGCCWSFAATAAYESYLSLNGFNYALSAQAALECTSFYAPNQRVSDCNGGYFPDPFYYLAKVGNVLDSSYPYISGSYGARPGFPTTPGVCTDRNRIFLGNGTISLYAPLISSGGLTVSQIKTILVTNGPQMIGVFADAGFMAYASGTYGCPSGANAVNSINHAILLVGWTSTGWIGKNQWGTGWGNSGYIEIDFINDCGLRFLLGSVTVSNKNSNVQVTMDTGYVYSYEPALLLTLALLALLLF